MAIPAMKVIEPPVRKSLINLILKRLVANLDVVKVILFGSYVSGKVNKDSDLRGGRVYLDTQIRFISDKLPVHIAACF